MLYRWFSQRTKPPFFIQDFPLPCLMTGKNWGSAVGKISEFLSIQPMVSVNHGVNPIDSMNPMMSSIPEVLWGIYLSWNLHWWRLQFSHATPMCFCFRAFTGNGLLFSLCALGWRESCIFLVIAVAKDHAMWPINNFARGSWKICHKH